jgi:hypothetical protein
MKNLIFAFAVSSALFIISCQESSLTDPVSVESANKVQIQEETIIDGNFPLSGVLVDPANRVYSHFMIEGGINYTHEKVFLDPIPSAPQYYISLKFSVNALLTGPEDSPNYNSWKISSNSEDLVYVSEEGILLIEKSYPVLGRSDGLTLVCRYLVTTEGVGLNHLWLEVGNNQGIYGDNLLQDTLTYPPVVRDHLLN